MIRLLHDNQNQWVDLSRPTDTNIESDELLDTAVLISLFTRKLADEDDVLPDENSLREGYWGDQYEKIPSHRKGSKLWLLRRSKATRSTLNLARVYALESLQWMIDDGIADTIEVEVERQNDGRLAFQVKIQRPEKVAPRWVATWSAHLGQL